MSEQRSPNPSNHVVRLWGGKVVYGTVLKRVGPLALVSWSVRESLDGSEPFSYYQKARWFPSWRVATCVADMTDGEGWREAS